MARYPLGQPVRVSTTVRDATGALVNPGTLTLLVKLAQADGTQLTTGTWAGVSFGEFDVFDALAEPAILPLQDAKDQLNIPLATDTADTEIQSYIATIKAN